MTTTIEYVADLFASIALILASYPARSWFLWTLGLSCMALTVVFRNVAAWREPKIEPKSQRTQSE